MVENDLVGDGDGDLAGYWGGFSGDVDGSPLGFLSPLFNGEDFHGKAVQVDCRVLCGRRVFVLMTLPRRNLSLD